MTVAQGRRVGVDQVRIVFVVKRRTVAQERLVYPLGDAVGRHEVAKLVRGVEKCVGRERSREQSIAVIAPIMIAVHDATPPAIAIAKLRIAMLNSI